MQWKIMRIAPFDPGRLLELPQWSSLLEKKKARALLWVHMVAGTAAFGAAVVLAVTGSRLDRPFLPLLYSLVTVHLLGIHLISLGRYDRSIRLLLAVYTAAWFAASYQGMRGLLADGSGATLPLALAVVALAGIFGTLRALAATAVILSAGMVAVAAASWRLSTPQVFALVRLQAAACCIGMALLCGLLAVVHRILDDAFSTNEEEFEKNLEMMKALEDQIREQTEQLLREKNSLKERNQEYEMELHMACQIQKKLIPSRAPVDYIYTLYRPMKLVGGDFFDFLRFRDSNRIGIFLSDVAGHGVPAAFVTSMVKSFILQAGARRENPADLLYYLNGLLSGQTADNFVTAFYGIYDPSTRGFIYASAGHNPPFLIYPERVETLRGSASIPLAVFDNDEMGHIDIDIVNNEISVPRGCSMLLYTDGLLEERNRENIQFQYGPLQEALLESRGIGGGGFIDNLYRRIVEFSGSESFYDDICLIYLNI
ncbi:MAG: SpoIIE family protein phosphatase [Spirochaetes bacterium]|nr:SpoIIE family protein phosphatase [Spirochaetota bacterium]